MSLLRPKEYPQIYVASEILESLKFPPSPIEPKKPTAPNMAVPAKYPSLKDNLQLIGLSFVGFAILFAVCIFVHHWLIICFMIICGIGAISGLFLTISSILKSKSFAVRMAAYNSVQSNYEQEYNKYLELYEIYLKEMRRFKEKFKSQRDVFEYRMKQQQKFLQEIKSKKRHEDFFDIEGAQNPKIGKSELLFRKYIESAIDRNLISPFFDFYYNTSVMNVSNNGMKVYDFYPDIIVLTPRGLLINVEIDEPYVAETKEPIHFYDCVDGSRDSYRNNVFTSCNCSVIRFSERQIMKYPEICLSIIRSFDDYAGIPSNLALPDDFKENIWTKEDAIRMAKENYRDSY